MSLQKGEGSGTAPLLELFFSPEILGNMNMQILRPQHDRDMQARTTTVLTWQSALRAVVNVSPQSVKRAQETQARAYVNRIPTEQLE